jgi:hypothetical protein
MTHLKTLLIAVPIALGLLAAPAAHAQWRGHGGWEHGGWDRGGWGHGRFEHRHDDRALTGALLGLGAVAVVGGIIASQQPPPAYYAPQPPYYSQPSYYSYPAPYYSAPYNADPGYAPQ